MNGLTWIAAMIGTIADTLRPARAEKPIIIPELPEVVPVLSLTLEKFTKVTELVIDGLEGGYYHPDMKKNFNERSQRMLGDSGETMFGIDRKHGQQLSKFAEWKTFWDLVDASKVKYANEWRYNKRGGILEGQLKKLTAAIMFKWFSYLSGKYILISSMDEIANDERLILHFSYGSWNGEGWFQRYSKALNNAVQNYEGDKEMIWQEAIKARTNSSNAVIRQQGDNLLAIVKKHNLH